MRSPPTRKTNERLDTGIPAKAPENSQGKSSKAIDVNVVEVAEPENQQNDEVKPLQPSGEEKKIEVVVEPINDDLNTPQSIVDPITPQTPLPMQDQVTLFPRRGPITVKPRVEPIKTNLEAEPITASPKNDLPLNAFNNPKSFGNNNSNNNLQPITPYKTLDNNNKCSDTCCDDNRPQILMSRAGPNSCCKGVAKIVIPINMETLSRMAIDEIIQVVNIVDNVEMLKKLLKLAEKYNL